MANARDPTCRSAGAGAGAPSRTAGRESVAARPSHKERPPALKGSEEFPSLSSSLNNPLSTPTQPAQAQAKPPAPLPSALDVVNNRHQILQDVHALNHEIGRMKAGK
nr:hypothetical protein HK105_008283 [Polyrhizophydium stewartii]